jgi:hypothetical protein
VSVAWWFVVLSLWWFELIALLGLGALVYVLYQETPIGKRRKREHHKRMMRYWKERGGGL